MVALLLHALLALLVDGCLSRISRLASDLTARIGLSSSAGYDLEDVMRINSPGQRFTATHGIALEKGQEKLLLFVVDRNDANFIAISSNIAVQGTRGGPEWYDIYVRYGARPTRQVHDRKATVTAADSYVGEVLYSRDIVIQNPKVGEYYFLLVARHTFRELLITAIVDVPPGKDPAAAS